MRKVQHRAPPVPPVDQRAHVGKQSFPAPAGDGELQRERRLSASIPALNTSLKRGSERAASHGPAMQTNAILNGVSAAATPSSSEVNHAGRCCAAATWYFLSSSCGEPPTGGGRYSKYRPPLGPREPLEGARAAQIVVTVNG